MARVAINGFGRIGRNALEPIWKSGRGRRNRRYQRPLQSIEISAHL